jgi:hypothetical protein
MATLTTSEIRKLYGFKANQEVVAFGRNIKLKPTQVVKHREPTLDDYGTREYNDHYDRRNKHRPTPAAPVLESQVSELTF